MSNNHKFLTNKTSFLVSDLVSLLSKRTMFDGNISDAKILDDISNSLNDEPPFWWTEQESNYLVNLKNYNDMFKYIVFRYKFRVYPIGKVVTDFPIYVLIEPVSSCNLRCPFCFQTDKKFTRKPFAGIMEMELFKRVVDECEDNGVGAITLASRGEPTLHPNFTEMLEYLKDKFFEIKINTNGTRLTDEICHSIFKNNINDIVLSIDTEKKELFEELRKNASFFEVLKNVKNLNRIRKEFYPNSRTIIRISGVQCRDEQDSVGFANFWGKWSDEITISKIEERWDTYNNVKTPELTTPCNYLWERFYVWQDGTCNPCDVDYMSKLSPGKIDTDISIRDIWNSEEYKNIRLSHMKGLRSDHNPCDRCGVS
jgi:radical SAM protein with 4Fe4S-binding SPASM domain